MSELPYVVAQSNTIFAPAGADPQSFTLDFSLEAILEGPIGTMGWGGELGAVIVVEGLSDYPAKLASGYHIVSPGPTEQAENGLTIVKLEEGGAIQVPGRVNPQGVGQGTIRGRRGTTGRSGGGASFGFGGPTPPPAGGGTT